MNALIHRSTLLSMIRKELGGTHADAMLALAAAIKIGAARRRGCANVELLAADVPAMLAAVCCAEVAA